MNRFCKSLIALAVCFSCLSGCSRLETEYGKTTGSSGRKSIGGFGVLREFYRQNDWNDRTLSRLSERLNNVDTIVLIQEFETPLSSEATGWFETWLGRGDKTLIYVLRDHRTEYEYWKQAARLAPPEQRLEYRRRLARAKLRRDATLLSRPAKITNGWFTAVPLTPPATANQLAGPWSETITVFQKPIELEYQVREFDRTKDTAAGAAAVPGPFPIPLDYTPTNLSVNFDVLLKDLQGNPVVSEITNDGWPDSEILVVSAGSLLTNYGLTDPDAQQLAGKLLAMSNKGNDGEEPKVGFLSAGMMGVRVSSLNPEDMGPTGMEMFTVYPLSLISIHLIIAMVLVCLMLFPIFGRPKRIPPRPTADFGDHIDAVAGLMRRTGGSQYARTRISEYMIRVRGESEGPWVIKAKEPAANLVPNISATGAATNSPSSVPSKAPEQETAISQSKPENGTDIFKGLS